MIIYDCSNSAEYTHRPPKDNEIVRYLKENAAQYGHSFTDDPAAGEVYFTNDIFPSTLENDKIKVKRMDGVFSRYDNKHRNESLNKAAAEADLVIFISEYARKSYYKLYGKEEHRISTSVVILNEADYKTFYPGKINNSEPKTVVCVADDWSRPEKRFEEIIKLANRLSTVQFVVVGRVNNVCLPSNIVLTGVQPHDKLANILRQADVMYSPFYRDPCPKTMVQAAYCGLPILYTDSGGQPEIKGTGVSIPDISSDGFDDYVPELSLENVVNAWDVLCKDYVAIREKSINFFGKIHFDKMISNYFAVMETFPRMFKRHRRMFDLFYR